MASSELRDTNRNQGTLDRDFSKIFVFDNRYENVTFLNNTGAELDLLPGTVVGRITATGEVAPLDAGAADGSQFPIGIVQSGIDGLADAATADIAICVSGDVVEDKIVLVNGETLDGTTISGKILRDRIGSDTVGVKLVASEELTNFDN